MEQPADLLDRTREWADLIDFAHLPGHDNRLGLVRGRRRQGKSFLLRRLAQATGGFYYQAVEEERVQALAGFGAALGTYLGVPGGRVAFHTWEDALGAILKLPTQNAPALVVLDEFPYLLHHSPELASLLQRAVDGSRDNGAPIRLVLCGSALSVMASLLTGSQALRGQALTDLVIRPFDYRTAAEYWTIDDAQTAFRVDAVLGGTPGYRDLLVARPPQRLEDIAAWLSAGPLNPSSTLFREDEYLLTEERSLSDRALYHSVVTALADGRTSQRAIAAALGREQRAVLHPLKALEDAGFVTRTDDALRDRRPIYSLSDPIVRFHHVITRRDLARFEDRRTAEAWESAQASFRTHVLGPHFEAISRRFVQDHTSESTIGDDAATVGPAVVNDARQKAQHQLDVVVRGRNNSGDSPVLALGEAKHTTTRRTRADLDRLDASERWSRATSLLPGEPG